MCIAVLYKIWNDQLISDSETLPDKLHIGVRHSEGMFLDNFKSQLFNLHVLPWACVCGSTTRGTNERDIHLWIAHAHSVQTRPFTCLQAYGFLIIVFVVSEL